MLENKSMRLRGVRVHNLKNVDLDIPLKQLVCFAGPSGSGKTSLAFHTILSESKRRFVNSFPNSMKFFADRPSPVDVDEIFPVLPVFGLPQVNPILGSRSVVSDVMLMTELLQSLYFHYSKEYCPTHLLPLQEITFSQQLARTTGEDAHVWHLLIQNELGAAILGSNFTPPRSWNAKTKQIGDFVADDEYWEVLRFKASTLNQVNERYKEVLPILLGKPLKLWREGLKKTIDFTYISNTCCPKCDYCGTKNLGVSAFSPHTALGACKACNGYGANLVYDEKKMLDTDLSVEEGGVAFLKFGPLDGWLQDLKKWMKKNKWPLDEPLKKLPKKFFTGLEQGEGVWEGFEEVKSYLNSKRYKPAVRVFIRKMQREETCQSCLGSRLDSQVKNFKLEWNGELKALAEVAKLGVSDLKDLASKTRFPSDKLAQKISKDLSHSLQLASDMGLGHLSLARKSRSLSAGEYQRLLLLKYLSFKGTDSLFVLDEPSLGLSPKEQEMLLKGIREIIGQGNTVLVIDHSEQIQKQSDHLVMMGPGSGHRGGEVLYSGNTDQWKFQETKPSTPHKKIKDSGGKAIEIIGAEAHGIKWGDFKIPLEKLIWVHGASGTGKSAVLVNVFAQHFYKKLYKENLVDEAGKFKEMKGGNPFTDVILVDANLNRFTSRSSVGTLTELATVVRRHFLRLPVAKAMGLKDGHLSPNSELGMCPRCEGKGQIVIEMQYLEDIVLECEDCHGKRLRPLYADLTDGRMTVAEAFNLPLSQVLEHIDLTPKFQRIWEYLKILNLDYLSLERQLNTLSGGERQRVYLLSNLLKRPENALIVFENLSFGLSSKEVLSLGEFLRKLAEQGNTLVVIDADPLFSHVAHHEISFD